MIPEKKFASTATRTARGSLPYRSSPGRRLYPPANYRNTAPASVGCAGRRRCAFSARSGSPTLAASSAAVSKHRPDEQQAEITDRQHEHAPELRLVEPIQSRLGTCFRRIELPSASPRSRSSRRPFAERPFAVPGTFGRVDEVDIVARLAAREPRGPSVLVRRAQWSSRLYQLVSVRNRIGSRLALVSYQASRCP